MQSLAGLPCSAALLRSSVCPSCSRIGSSAASSRASQPSQSFQSHSSSGLPCRTWRNLQSDAPRRTRARASGNDEQQNSAVTTSSEDEKEELAAKLAAAEAEAEALKRELALRRAGSKDGDLAKLKPATPEKRIDGTGFRETMFSVPGQDQKQPGKKWGLTEAELFLSKGAPTEGMGLQGEAMAEGAEKVVTRRLIGGIGLAVVALGLASVKLPAILSRPSKPLFFYLTYILRLKETLETLEATGSDAKVVEAQLARAYGSSDELKDNFLSAAALLEAGDVDRGTKLCYDVFEFLFQANSSKYFDDFGQPTAAQQAEFLKFSLQSIQAARSKIQEFLRLVPADALDAAKLQLSR
ncbi:hypothetical protein MPTK1_3g01370 [Marchantia polymorpha subsp. ruderalis]|uniref:Uncharacterized protein n=2 Tax=Marchantia polymorpha TaxID=3197 RepID=A0AAF6AWA5_MARPO|nr:hypothetical protein MARPO_0007s0131 [Marchantia polymorpha]BBN04039.1 hypothetical protein Mp_3g01370 [Marchantia polymorpha subsp. ruderalis]|eukprot:PTQ47726.1 hypothetical protein MARPO_0007s0131 [Marchantia polymorpha]